MKKPMTAVVATLLAGVALANIPDNYTVVDYVESTGKQTINSFYTVTANTKVVTDLVPLVTSGDLLIYGKSENNYGFGFRIVNGMFRFYGVAYDICSAVAGTRYITTIGQSVATVMDKATEQTWTRTISADTGTIRLFGNSGNRMSSVRIYGMQIYEGSELVRNFIPCRNPDSEPGLYDLVTDTYYINNWKGTGWKPLVAGPDVIQTNALEITTSFGDDPGTAPACGLVSDLSDGSQVVCSAPATYRDPYGSYSYACTGYRLYDCTLDRATGKQVLTELVGSPYSGTSFTYTHGTAMRKLVWQYTPTYLGTNIYIGIEGGSWSKTLYWSKREVPGAGDVVIIDGKKVTLTGVGAGTTVKDLVIKDGSFLVVQAPAAADPRTFATVYPSAYKFNVTGTFKIEKGGTFQPLTDVLSGNPVFVNCADFVLDEGGQIKADESGYGWALATGVDTAALIAAGHQIVTQNDGYSYCPGAGMGYGSLAGYGAKGTRAGSAYGYQYAPWLSGGVSGLYNKYASASAAYWNGWARGGGAVVIFASGKQTLAGEIWANGAYRFYNGSAGGGIWLVGNGFEIRSTARLNANGSSDNYSASNKGGRISLGAGLTATHVENLVTGQVPAKVSLACGDNLNFINAHTYGGLSNTDADIIDRVRTEDGTRTYTVNTNTHTLVAVKAIGMDGAENLNGVLLVPSSDMVTVALEKLKSPSATNVHYSASAWRLLNGSTELASGTGNTASWSLGEKYALLTLEWTVDNIVTDAEPDFFADVPAGTGATKTFVGANGGAWEESSNWSPAGVPGLSDTVTLAGKTVYATTTIGAAALTVASDAKLVIGGTGADVLAETAAEGTRFGLKVVGDCSITGQVAVGGKDLTAPARVLVGGNLTLEDAAILAVYATRASKYDFMTLYREATPVTISGKLKLNGTSQVVPDADYLTGAPVHFTVGAVEIAASAKFNAVARGWGWTSKTGNYTHGIRGSFFPNNGSGQLVSAPHNETYSPGSGGCLWNGATGAGYGGLGDRSSANSGRAYGYQYAPFLPGSCAYYTASRGAGAIWIDCNGHFALDGTLDASGNSAATSSSSRNTTGGGIWVSAMGFAAGSTAQILASGGSTSGVSYGAAGGRISLALATTAADRYALAKGETPAGLTYMTGITGVSTVSAAGGAGSYSSGTTPYMAKDGTITTVRGTVVVPTVHVVGDPVNAVSAGTSYGDIATSIGASITLTASEYGVDPNDTHVRYTCTGYLATNATGTVVAQGVGRSATFTVADADTYFTWLWGNRQSGMDVVLPAGVGASVKYDNTVYTGSFSVWANDGGELEAISTDAAAYEFLYWLGDVPLGFERSAKITLPGGAYRSVTPVFRPKSAPATRTWLGGTGSWTDAAKWDGGVIPGLGDTAVVGSGVCYVSNYVACANLTVNGTAKLIAGGCLLSGLTTVIPTYPSISVFPYANVLIGRIVVELTGTLTVAGSAEMCVNASNPSYYFCLDAEDVSLGGSSKLVLNAGPRTETQTYDSGTGFFTVSNDLAIADTAQLFLYSDSYSGGSTICHVGRRFTVTTNAVVNACEGGFWVDISKSPQSLEPLPQGTSWGCAASHGGEASGVTYDAPYAPRMPGATTTSPYDGNPARTSPGAGVIRIHAHRASVAGTLKATTGATTDRHAAGAGGTIWLTADVLDVAPGAQFNVKGSSNLYGGIAGGGRISICRALKDAELAELTADGDTLPTGRLSRRTAKFVRDEVAFTNEFPGVTVALDASSAAGSKSRGTFYFLDGKTQGLMLLVK